MDLPKYKEGDKVQVEGWGDGVIKKVLDPNLISSDPYYASKGVHWYNVYIHTLNNDYDMPETALSLLDRPMVMKVTNLALKEWMEKMKKAGYG